MRPFANAAGICENGISTNLSVFESPPFASTQARTPYSPIVASPGVPTVFPFMSTPFWIAVWLPTKSHPVAGCEDTYSAAGETMMNGMFFACAIASVVIVAIPMSTAPDATAVATAAP